MTGTTFAAESSSGASSRPVPTFSILFELNFIFEIILQKYSIGLMIVGNLGSRRMFEKEISVLL